MKKLRIASIVTVVSLLLTSFSMAAWYDGAVRWARNVPVIEETFDPNAKVIHGELIGAMYDCAVKWGMDVSAAKNTNILSYDDAIFLPEGTAESFQWACTADLIDDAATKLEYDRVLTREEMVALVYGFARWMKLDMTVGENTNILSYNDAFSISEGKSAAFQWACGTGVIVGTPEHNLLPKAEALNSQMVTVLQRVERLAAPVNYNTGISTWMCVPSQQSETWNAFVRIDSCQYGTAGSSLRQTAAAVSLLQLTKMEDASEVLYHYLREMNATQKDFFSFQWQMSLKKAGELLADPAAYAGALSDCGCGDVDLISFTAAAVAALDAAVKQQLQENGVTDVWKTLTNQEPFNWYK